jgi:hypothetical protein
MACSPDGRRRTHRGARRRRYRRVQLRAQRRVALARDVVPGEPPTGRRVGAEVRVAAPGGLLGEALPLGPPRASLPLASRAPWGAFARPAAAAVALALAVGSSGCVSVVGPSPRVTAAELGMGRGLVVTTSAPLEPRGAHVTMSEAREREALGGFDRPAVLLPVHAGDPGRPHVVVIHGINAAPGDVAPLTQAAIARGGPVSVLAWDDQRRRLDASADDLAGQLAGPLAGRPVRLEAHSMGARVALAAVARAHARRAALGPIELVLVAPHLGGSGAADGARWAPGFLASRIGGIRPGLDMGTRSAFQAELETLSLPPGTRIRVLLAEHDTIVDARAPGFRRVLERLGVEAEVISGAGHGDVLGPAAARRLP